MRILPAKGVCKCSGSPDGPCDRNDCRARPPDFLCKQKKGKSTETRRHGGISHVSRLHVSRPSMGVKREDVTGRLCVSPRLRGFTRISAARTFYLTPLLC